MSDLYSLTPTPYQTTLLDSGALANGALIHTYAANSSTPIATYADSIGTPNANPIVADAYGRWVCYLTPGVAYKFEITTSTGVAIRTQDYVYGVPSGAGIDISGVAGENLTAGQVVYLSDGSGSKTAGKWYKADSSLDYASIIPQVGMVPLSIASGSSGSIRLAGQISGLSLTTGLDYFLGAAGALTTTAPTLARKIGRAISATALVVGLPSVQAEAWANDFRLTLTTAVPVTPTDVTGATTIYCTPMTGNRIDLPDANGNPIRLTSVEFSIAVPATTATMYDIFCYDNAGVATLELLAWTNATLRATAIIRTVGGRYYKSGDVTRMYLGSVSTAGVSGQTEDSAAKRYLWNYFNRVQRTVSKTEATASWTYTTAAIRQANGGTTNQVEIVEGVAEDVLDLSLIGAANNATNGVNVSAGIGEDSTATFTAGTWAQPDAVIWNFTCRLVRNPAVGRHLYSWNEYSVASGTTTWYGLQTVGAAIAMGLYGTWRA